VAISKTTVYEIATLLTVARNDYLVIGFYELFNTFKLPFQNFSVVWKKIFAKVLGTLFGELRMLSLPGDLGVYLEGG